MKLGLSGGSVQGGLCFTDPENPNDPAPKSEDVSFGGKDQWFCCVPKKTSPFWGHTLAETAHLRLMVPIFDSLQDGEKISVNSSDLTVSQ